MFVVLNSGHSWVKGLIELDCVFSSSAFPGHVFVQSMGSLSQASERLAATMQLKPFTTKFNWMEPLIKACEPLRSFSIKGSNEAYLRRSAEVDEVVKSLGFTGAF